MLQNSIDGKMQQIPDNLQCWTQGEIAEKLEISQQSVGRSIQNSIDGKMDT